MSTLGSVGCHDEHRMLGLRTQSLRQGQSTGWEGLVEGEELAGSVSSQKKYHWKESSGKQGVTVQGRADAMGP